MNLPNKLSLIRVGLIPFFLLFMAIDIPYNYLIALLVFVVASITDALDGSIARKHNLITDFGKFLDPLADKMLVMSAIICFTALGWVDFFCVILILSREFMVSGLRLVVANEGVVVPAGIMGKLKTAFTMVAIIVILFMHGIGHGIYAVDMILIWISTILTVVSGLQYLKAYWPYINTDK